MKHNTDGKHSLPVNVNLSSVFVKTLMDTLHSWNNFKASQQMISNWKPFYIVNKTGEMLCCWISSDKHKQQWIAADECRPLEMSSSFNSSLLRAAFRGKLLKYNRLSVSFKVGDVASFENIDVSITRRRKVSHTKLKICVVIHVLFRKGSKYVYIWSPCEIRNHSSTPIRLRIQYDTKALRLPDAARKIQSGGSGGVGVGASENDASKGSLAQLQQHHQHQRLEPLDFGTIPPGKCVPIPLRIDPDRIFVSIKPEHRKGWSWTRAKSFKQLYTKDQFYHTNSNWDHPEQSQNDQNTTSTFGFVLLFLCFCF